MRKLLVFAKEGKLNEEIHIAGSYNAKTPPIIESDFVNSVNKPFVAFAVKKGGDKNIFLSFLRGIYETHGRRAGFGHYGDVISLLEIESADMIEYVVTAIDQLAFPKGVLTVDLVPVFVDKDNNQFFVGITIGKGKHRGEPALIGGHLDLNGYHFETPAEASVHEAKDEAGIIFSPTVEFKEKIAEVPFLEKVQVEVDLNGKKYPAELKMLKTYRTSSEEKIDKLGRKRVDWTTAYYLVVNVDFPLDKKKIASLLKAGDDAESLIIVKLGVEETPKFAYGHHKEIFLDAIRKF